MRKPSTYQDLYSWWIDTVNGRQPDYTDEPQCGYYRAIFKKGHPAQPIEITCRQSIEDGQLTDDEQLIAIFNDGRTADPEKLWTYLKPITVAAFDALQAMVNSDDRMKATDAEIDLSIEPVRLK